MSIIPEIQNQIQALKTSVDENVDGLTLYSTDNIKSLLQLRQELDILSNKVSKLLTLKQVEQMIKTFDNPNLTPNPDTE